VHVVHPREVDHDRVVVGREPGDAVTAAPDGDLEVVAPRERNGGHHVGRTDAADDDRGSRVVCAVPDPSSLVVLRIGRRHDVAADGFA
jgi:hypothetical protein